MDTEIIRLQDSIAEVTRGQNVLNANLKTCSIVEKTMIDGVEYTRCGSGSSDGQDNKSYSAEYLAFDEAKGNVDDMHWISDAGLVCCGQCRCGEFNVVIRAYEVLLQCVDCGATNELSL